MQAYSLDLRARVVSAYEKGGNTIAAIAEQFAVGQTLLKKMLRQKRETGSVERLPQGAGAKAQLSEPQRKWLAEQIQEVPDATLAELQERVAQEKHVVLSTATVCRELKAWRLPRKKSQ
jgi:transposase